MFVAVEREHEHGFMVALKTWVCTRDEFEAALLAYNTEPEPADIIYWRMTSPFPLDEDELGVFKMRRIIKRMNDRKELLDSKLNCYTA